jgi:hypothetical protein
MQAGVTRGYDEVTEAFGRIEDALDRNTATVRIQHPEEEQKEEGV